MSLLVPQNYTCVRTQDGSPTLKKGDKGELMHSLSGAALETQILYAPLLQVAVSELSFPRILSVGLGLGYVELFWAALCQKHERPWMLWSFEKDDALRVSLIEYLKAPDSSSVYHEVVNSVGKLCPTSERLPHVLLEAWHQGQWCLFGTLDQGAPRFEDGFGVIIYDPFSAQTDEGLWSEEALDWFLSSYAAPVCVLASYASRRAFHRVLAAHGFEVRRRPGIGAKRESTWAWRGGIELPLLLSC